jgi:hypothetical protein
MAGIRIAHLNGNGYHALLGFAEQAFRLIHPEIDLVVQRRYAHSTLEQAMEVKLAQAAAASLVCLHE